MKHVNYGPLLQIESISELEKLKGLHLTTLFLENNPVCESYSKASDYLRFSPPSGEAVFLLLFIQQLNSLLIQLIYISVVQYASVVVRRLGRANREMTF